MTLKSLKLDSVALFRLTFIYNVYEVVGQNEGYAFAFESEFFLKMAQNVTEIDVKQLPGFLHHYIIGMSVGYSENVCRDTVTGAAQSEFLDSFVQRHFCLIVIL